VNTSGDLQALRVAVSDQDRAAALYLDLLGAVEAPLGWTFTPGVAVRIEDGPPTGVVGLVVSVNDPAAVARRLSDEFGFAVAADEAGAQGVDAREVLGTTLTFVPEAVPSNVMGGGGSAGVTSLDHVCLGVHDLKRASDVLQGSGAVPVFGGDSPLGVRSMHLKFGLGKVELLTPLRDDSDVGRHLARRGGPAPHHVTFMVDDVARAEVAARDAGFATTWTNLDDDMWQETYLRPTDGMLIQLARTPLHYDDVLDPQTYQDVFDGRYWVASNLMRPIEEVTV
jgi:catechol 2,3-dioxygenase-like lactoylglutathione lyase family enzyme